MLLKHCGASGKKKKDWENCLYLTIKAIGCKYRLIFFNKKPQNTEAETR